MSKPKGTLSRSDEPIKKLEHHMELLRQEHVKLQQKHIELDHKYQIAVANRSPDESVDGFVGNLINTVSGLFNKDSFSDITIGLQSGATMKGHRIVLESSRGNWGCDLERVSLVELTTFRDSVARAVLQWVYTNKIVFVDKPENFPLDVIKAASLYKLDRLKRVCEQTLLSLVNVKNCISFFEVAEEFDASILRSHCSEVLSSHWDEFTVDDFSRMPAPLLYQMFKNHTGFPLHAAIRNNREDIVFLYLMEHDVDLRESVNQTDEDGCLPIDLALKGRQDSIARTLVDNKADINSRNINNQTLLHTAIERGDHFAAMFLINQECDIHCRVTTTQHSALHLCSFFTGNDAELADVVDALLERSCDVNARDASSNTPLHLAINYGKSVIVDKLLSAAEVNAVNDAFESPLLLALLRFASQRSLVDQLIAAGADPEVSNPGTEERPLHAVVREGQADAAEYLVRLGCVADAANSLGETAMHLAVGSRLAGLVGVLLEAGCDPNRQTKRPGTGDPRPPREPDASLSDDDDSEDVSGVTPFHLAVKLGFDEIVEKFLDHQSRCRSSSGSLLPLDLSLADSEGHTVLALALWANKYELAKKLLVLGADINRMSPDGLNLLHSAILSQNAAAALFLIEAGCWVQTRTRGGSATGSERPAGESPLLLAIGRHLPSVVDALCARGSDMAEVDAGGDPCLWVALETGQEDVASILLRHGCDPTGWAATGPGGCLQTLLHRAVDENNEPVACFLIRGGCDVDAARRPGPDGAGDLEARDQQSPLHIAASWGLFAVVECLLEHGANVNAVDSEAKAPIHIAITNQHVEIIELLVGCPAIDLSRRDAAGQTPFACAMTFRNNKAAQSILSREPTAAEQTDNRGRNFLHVAIQNNDIEAVLFLLSVGINVNTPIRDNQRLAPLHLAVNIGSEIILRNLLLAGCDVNQLTSLKQPALHLAVGNDSPSIASILTDNGCDYSLRDVNGDSALHVAAKRGHVASVKQLLGETHIDAEGLNGKGETPLHGLAYSGRETATVIFGLFVEAMPEYPLNLQDGEGNTYLLHAYTSGNVGLCKWLVRAGVRLGVPNAHGVNIFNHQVATKQLLFKMLELLRSEAPWTEWDACLQCGVRFTLTVRKHHCRHCGRILCSKCSDKVMPILKFELTKPARICDTCNDVLTLGSNQSS